MFCVTYGNGWCFIILYNISVPFQQGWWRGFLKIHAENIPLLSLSNVTLIVKESRLREAAAAESKSINLALGVASTLAQKFHENLSSDVERAFFSLCVALDIHFGSMYTDG